MSPILALLLGKLLFSQLPLLLRWKQGRREEYMIQDGAFELFAIPHEGAACCSFITGRVLVGLRGNEISQA